MADGISIMKCTDVALVETPVTQYRDSYSALSALCNYPHAQASRGSNRVGVRINMSSKKIVIERTRDLIYLKFVVTDFSPKIISPSAGENSGDLA